jgi:hypothetical protein
MYLSLKLLAFSAYRYAAGSTILLLTVIALFIQTAGYYKFIVLDRIDFVPFD